MFAHVDNPGGQKDHRQQHWNQQKVIEVTREESIPCHVVTQEACLVQTITEQGHQKDSVAAVTNRHAHVHYKPRLRIIAAATIAATIRKKRPQPLIPSLGLRMGWPHFGQEAACWEILSPHPRHAMSAILVSFTAAAGRHKWFPAR